MAHVVTSMEFGQQEEKDLNYEFSILNYEFHRTIATSHHRTA